MKARVGMGGIVEQLIAEAKMVYSKAGLNCADGLLPPVNDLELEAMEKGICMPIPVSLREVYRIHGGQDYIEPGVSGLFGNHRLFTPLEVVENYQMLQESCGWEPLPRFPPASREIGYWASKLIPFAAFDAWYLCLQSGTEEVWEFNPHCGLIRFFPTLAATLLNVLTNVQSGKGPELDGWRESLEE